MIRKAETYDIPIVNSICQSHKALRSIDDDKDYTTWLIEHVDKSFFYVYEIDSKVVGFIFAERLLGDGVLIWMSGFFKEYLNKGYGKELFEYLINEIKKSNISWALAYGYQENRSIIKILTTNGFKTNNNIYKEYLWIGIEN